MWIGSAFVIGWLVSLLRADRQKIAGRCKPGKADQKASTMTAITPNLYQTPSMSHAPSQTHVRSILARVLDRAADHQLHLGHHHQAERLSRQAADLREVAR